MMSGVIFISVILWLYLNKFVNSELFTAVADFEETLIKEHVVLENVLQYVKRREAKLDMLRRYAEEIRNNQRQAEIDQKLLSHPITLYHSIKRLSSDWNDINAIMNNEQDIKNTMNNITEHRSADGMHFPGEEDITGAAVGLFRLQDTYNLNTHDIANGNISGVLHSPVLTAGQCFELGMQAYHKQPDYYHALLWFQEAYEKLKTENIPTVNELEVLDYLAYCMYKQSNFERATYLIRKLKSLSPDYDKVDGNLKYYNNLMKERGIDMNKYKNDADLPPIRTTRSVVNYPGFGDFNVYESLCRGEYNHKTSSPSFYCYYKHNNAFLRTAPLKAEIVHIEPRIVLYHDVISDIESAVIRKLSAPKLARAMVTSANGTLEPANYRISKSGWLQDDEHTTVKSISKRIEDMTDLTTETAEALQLATYGIGGHYETHYDFAQKHETHSFKRDGGGNRIGTVLFYLTEPSAGGATVFPFLNLTLYPSKNDAVMWYNLYKNGDGDLSLLHAACPVLSGIKWVANKWLHEHGQEFVRPCALNEDEYE